MSKNNLKLALFSLVCLTLSSLLLNSAYTTEQQKRQIEQFNQEILGNQSQTTEFGERALVTKVADGDTITAVLNGQEVKVRYIGIDTPETVDPRRPVGCFGKEASDENKRLVEGQQIYLEKDVSDTDKFGRLLRYVYLPLEDGSMVFVNDYLIRQGFANASSYPPDVKYNDQFTKAQTEAQENLRGLWKSCQ